MYSINYIIIISKYNSFMVHNICMNSIHLIQSYFYALSCELAFSLKRVVKFVSS